ncbi:hypothetical protein GCM10009584_23590 [Ornithinimicrobium humiphilum]|uniref:Hemerythrin-like domain-containing protein n=1 Tax=Ornithinimicrobium humiphilum TaxID=125288 RepID=A0A543KMN9_9MICO|nr:hemerythrin domain-containing protein [Ornithinimicrobium humiphilum]TQM96348.1 hypothetical protein FB476_1214 [Ornithinimicrobium humiphilum]
MAAVPEGLEQHLEQVRAYRAELRESMAAVRTALSNTSAGGLSRQRVHAALVELARDLAEHVDLAERPDGLFQGVRAVPRLASAVDQLTAEHPTLLTDLQDYIGLLEGSDGIADVPAFRDEVARLLDRLVEHRRRGDDLIYEAFAVDIGGQD